MMTCWHTHTHTHSHNDTPAIVCKYKQPSPPFSSQSYLLGLLAMIKCSICSYQCDNWYVSNWRLACHINFYMGRCFLELAQKPSSVALAWHLARSSTPFGVTMSFSRRLCSCFSCLSFSTCQEPPANIWPMTEQGSCVTWAGVFVFTLDCNNHIYCYDTDDDHVNSRLADIL